MLAALAVLLLQCQHRVVYISDCYQLVQDPVDVLRKALVAAFIDDDERSEEIKDAQNAEQLDQCCKRLRESGVQMTFIIDQINAFDPHPDMPESPQALVKKGVAKDLIDHCSSGHVCLCGASANNQTAKHFRHRQQGATGFIIDLNGGFSQVSHELEHSFDEAGTQCAVKRRHLLLLRLTLTRAARCVCVLRWSCKRG